jgi:hypothetical protein
MHATGADAYAGLTDAAWPIFQPAVREGILVVLLFDQFLMKNCNLQEIWKMNYCRREAERRTRNSFHCVVHHQ